MPIFFFFLGGGHTSMTGGRVAVLKGCDILWLKGHFKILRHLWPTYILPHIGHCPVLPVESGQHVLVHLHQNVLILHQKQVIAKPISRFPPAASGCNHVSRVGAIMCQG